MNIPNSIDLANWMLQLEEVIDSRPLRCVAIPGTHDSAMYPGMLPADYAKTQELDFTGQLNAGARFFDFRCAYFPSASGMSAKFGDGSAATVCFGNWMPGPGFYLYGHATYVVNVTIRQALDQITAWLNAHFDEMVIIKVHCGTDQDKVTREILDCLDANQVYRPPQSSPPPQNVPFTQLRGRIVLLGDSGNNYLFGNSLRSLGYAGDSGIEDPRLMTANLNQCLNKTRPIGVPASADPLLFELVAPLTPEGEGHTLIPANPRDLAIKWNPSLARFMQTPAPGPGVISADPGWRGRALNVVTVDYIDISNVAESIIRSNFYITP